MKDLPTNEMKTYIFDAVFVCNGHFSDPNLPTFEGIDQFEGSQVHSHDYRKASAYKGSIDPITSEKKKPNISNSQM